MSSGGLPIIGYQVSCSDSSGNIIATKKVTTLSTQFTGLNNGQLYSISVETLTAFGPSAPVGGTRAPVTNPSPPSNLVIIPSNSSATISWTASSNNGGSPITGYIVTIPTIGVQRVTDIPAIITGLSNGQTYTVSVQADNTVGLSVPLNGTFVPCLAPGPPTGLTITYQPTALIVRWVAPANTGGSPLTGYITTLSTVGLPDVVLTIPSYSLTTTFSGLTTGTTYTISIVSKTLGGTSIPATITASPGTVPAPPTNLIATPADSSASISWTPPAGTVTGYSVKIQPGSALLTQTVNTPYASFRGLTNGTQYTFTVFAINSVGLSQGAGITTTPATFPGKVTNIVTSISTSSITVTWNAPSYTGGVPLTGYSITNGITTQDLGPRDILSAIFSGLTNGTPYTFTVNATNIVGSSSTSITATSGSVPGPPIDLSGTTVGPTTTITWNPGSTGGYAITGYTTSIAPGGTTNNTVVTNISYQNLVLGSPYTINIIAKNILGSSIPAVLQYTPAVRPNSPSMTVVVGATSATLTWTAPYNGGATISSYTASCTGSTQTVTGLTATLTGLQPGTLYVFNLVATNRIGSSLPSSVSATTLSYSGAPTGLSTQSSSTQIIVTWSPPSNPNGTILNYTVTGNNTTQTITGLSATFTGLTNGTPYTFTVVANTLAGSSSEATITETPAGVPNAPINLSLEGIGIPGNQEITLTWDAPADNGSAIIDYKGSYAGIAEITVASPYTFTGLTNGTPYTFQIKARNRIGLSIPASITATPLGPPSNPTAMSPLIGTSGNIGVGFFPPANNGGSSIVLYNIYFYDSNLNLLPNGMIVMNPGPSGQPMFSPSYSNLTNGDRYYIVVSAKNNIGSSPTTYPNGGWVLAIPGQAPSAPALTLVSVGPGTATVSWTAPQLYGYPITGYTASINTGPEFSIGIPSSLSYTFTGLTNGVESRLYITVYASGITGYINSSTSSILATPTGNPGRVTNLIATPGPTSVVVSWLPPLDNGGSAITEYLGTYTYGGSERVVTSPYTFTGLSNSTPYSFTIIAKNAQGYFGQGNTVDTVTTITLTVPDVPQNFNVTAISQIVGYVNLRATWNPPTNNGGATIDRYVFNTVLVQTVVGTPPASDVLRPSALYIGPIYISPSDPGTSSYSFFVPAAQPGGQGAPAVYNIYTFSVLAENAQGQGNNATKIYSVR